VKYQLTVSTLLFTLLSILPGCWDLEEVDRRAFATTLGIDTNPSHQFILTVQIPIPQKMLPQHHRFSDFQWLQNGGKT
jgi:hypothetical protein